MPAKPTLAWGAQLAAGAASADGVGASLLTQQHPFYISLAEAMTAEAEAEGIPLEIAIANQDLNKQLSDVEDFITKEVDVIVISPVDSQGVRAAIKKALSAGIKVITVDIPAAGVDVTSYVGTDNFTGGVKAGELVAKVLDGKGKVESCPLNLLSVLLRGRRTRPWADHRPRRGRRSGMPIRSWLRAG